MSDRANEILATVNAFMPGQADLLDVRSALIALAEVVAKQEQRIKKLEHEVGLMLPWLTVVTNP